jgi:hypothetical protein
MAGAQDSDSRTFLELGVRPVLDDQHLVHRQLGQRVEDDPQLLPGRERWDDRRDSGHRARVYAEGLR